MRDRAAMLGLAAASLAAVGCGGGDGLSVADGSVRDGAVDLDVSDTGPDAIVPIDLGIRRDFGMAADGSADDGDVDASMVDDAGADGAAGCGACVATGPCDVAACSISTCVHTPASDATDCGGGSICVVGSCVSRGCGDGYREPGPTPAREECDDGNTVSGDGCSSTCAVETVALPGDAGATDDPTTGAPPAAADGTGAILVVWEASGTSASIEGLRRDRFGAPLDSTPRTIVMGYPAGASLDPVVAGLSVGGWVVAWSTGAAIDYAVVAPDGSVGVPFEATEDPTEVPSSPRLTSLSHGFVAVWTAASSPTAADPYEGIRARVFDDAASPVGHAFVVPHDPSARELGAAVVAASATDDEWLVAWTTAPPFGSPGTPTVRGRRFRTGLPRDATDLDLGPASSHDATVDALSGHDYVLAWVSDVPESDIHARIVLEASPSYDAIGDIPIAVTTGVEERSPSIAALGSGFVVAWLDGSSGGPPTTADFAAGGGVALGPEATTIRDSFTGVLITHVGLVRARGDGVYLSWSSRAGGRPGLPAEDAMLAYLGRD